MNVGTLCFSTVQGIGILAKEFYRNGVLSDALVVNHGRRAENPTWFIKDGKLPDTLYSLSNPRDIERAREYCRSHDVMLFFETPFIWQLIPFCKSIGVKTVLMVMYECMPKELPAIPDLFICPSLLDLVYYPPDKYNSVFIPVPVAVEWKPRTTSKIFVHNSGNGGLKGRNGSLELLKAMMHVKSNVQLIFRSQSRPPTEQLELIARDSRIYYDQSTLAYDELYSTGDVFIFPEKFNGLSLPLQEARASGMLVVSTDRFPMNTWLPTEPLIPVKKYNTSSVSPRCNEFSEAVVSPTDIANTIDNWFCKDITEYSLSGKDWAETMSWDVLKPRYIEALSR